MCLWAHRLSTPPRVFSPHRASRAGPVSLGGWEAEWGRCMGSRDLRCSRLSRLSARAGWGAGVQSRARLGAGLPGCCSQPVKDMSPSWRSSAERRVGASLRAEPWVPQGPGRKREAVAGAVGLGLMEWAPDADPPQARRHSSGGSAGSSGRQAVGLLSSGRLGSAVRLPELVQAAPRRSVLGR